LSKIDNQSFFQHEGEEIIFLLKGKLILYVDNKKYELYEGDSAAFDSKLPHWLENETEEYITYITAMTPVFL
jgi:quercetin dioxygenase-like cupin family protein